MLNQAGANYSVADKGKLSNLNRSLKEMLDGSKCSDSRGTGTTGTTEVTRARLQLEKSSLSLHHMNMLQPAHSRMQNR